jgi:hypothetical protein
MIHWRQLIDIGNYYAFGEINSKVCQYVLEAGFIYGAGKGA